MYERSYGYQYEAQKGLTTVEIAKLIRGDIKTAIKEGLLPNRWKYSVRSAYFAGGSAIDVAVKNCEDAWQDCDGFKVGSKSTVNGVTSGQLCGNYWCSVHNDSPNADKHKVLTEEAEAAKLTLERIWSAYNHDGSEVQLDYWDVNYYGSVNFSGRY